MHILAMCVADLAAVVSSADVHTAHLGYFVGEPSDLVTFGVGREGKALVRVMVWAGLLLTPSATPRSAGLFPIPVAGVVASGKTAPAKLLTFWRRRFCFLVSRLSNDDSIASALSALAQDEAYSWTRVSSVVRSRS